MFINYASAYLKWMSLIRGVLDITGVFNVSYGHEQASPEDPERISVSRLETLRVVASEVGDGNGRMRKVDDSYLGSLGKRIGATHLHVPIKNTGEYPYILFKLRSESYGEVRPVVKTESVEA